jgi:hypothetical protein
VLIEIVGNVVDIVVDDNVVDHFALVELDDIADVVDDVADVDDDVAAVVVVVVVDDDDVEMIVVDKEYSDFDCYYDYDDDILALVASYYHNKMVIPSSVIKTILT